MGKNVAVFVDVANIFYAAKAAGTDIDYVTLLKAATAGRDFVRAYAYTGLDPDNENQRNFHAFLARNQYKVVSKDIRKYGDGKVKANLDIELVVDMMKTARNLDIAIVVSGDGDFAPAIRAVQEMGVRGRGHQLPRQHLQRPDRGRGPLHRHHPARARRQVVVALGPAGRRRRRGPVDDRGPRQADRGHGRARPRARSRPGPARRGRAGRREASRRGARTSAAPAARSPRRPTAADRMTVMPGEKLVAGRAARPRPTGPPRTSTRTSSTAVATPPYRGRRRRGRRPMARARPAAGGAAGAAVAVAVAAAAARTEPSSRPARPAARPAPRDDRDAAEDEERPRRSRPGAARSADDAVRVLLGLAARRARARPPAVDPSGRSATTRTSTSPRSPST